MLANQSSLFSIPYKCVNNQTPLYMPMIKRYRRLGSRVKKHALRSHISSVHTHSFPFAFAPIMCDRSTFSADNSIQTTSRRWTPLACAFESRSCEIFILNRKTLFCVRKPIIHLAPRQPRTQNRHFKWLTMCFLTWCVVVRHN